jgi:hypothetical protein
VAWLPNGNPYSWSTPFGDYFLDLTGYDDRSPYFGVSQAINTTIGDSYVLSLYLGVDNSNSPGPISVQVDAGPVTQTLTANPSGSGNIWTAFSVDFTADSAMSTISIQGTQGLYFIGLDNVSVNLASVPEPSSLILSGISAILGLGCWIIRQASLPRMGRP